MLLALGGELLPWLGGKHKILEIARSDSNFRAVAGRQLEIFAKSTVLGQNFLPRRRGKTQNFVVSTDFDLKILPWRGGKSLKLTA